MAIAQVKMNVTEAVSQASRWSRTQGFEIDRQGAPTQPDSSGNSINCERLTSKSAWIVINWSFETTPNGTVIQMRIRHTWYVSVLILAVAFLVFGVLYSRFSRLHGEIPLRDSVALGLWVAVAWMLLSCVSRWWRKTRRLTREFWDYVAKSCEIELLAPVEASLEPKWMVLLFYGMFWVAILRLMAVAGIGAFLLALLLAVPSLLDGVMRAIYRGSEHLNWRLWLWGNAYKWTVFMLSLIIVPVILGLFESTMVRLERSGYKSTSGMPVSWGQYRGVSPATASLLETDARDRINKWAEACVRRWEGVEEESIASSRHVMSLVMSGTFLAFLMVAFLFMYRRGLRSLLRSARFWRQEIGERDWRRGPFVPSMRGSWKWKARGATVLMVLHYISGGLLNLLIGAFYLEGLSYMVSGRTFLTAKSAHLWSWPFSWAEELFGGSLGRIVPSTVIIMATLPFFLCFGKMLHRCVHFILQLMRVLFGRSLFSWGLPDKLLKLRAFINEACITLGIGKPEILITGRGRIRFRSFWFPLWNKGVLQLSRNSIEILGPQELKAAIAHELGHLRQGFFLVFLLKALSVLAFFPNYYLTMCINWSKREMEADRCALRLTGNPDALRHALLKLSAAELWTRPKPRISKLMRKVTAPKWAKTILEQAEQVVVAARFFFGDGILGYTHPFLSERLAAISSYEESSTTNQQEKAEQPARG